MATLLTVTQLFGQLHLELGTSLNVPLDDFELYYNPGIGFYAEPKYALNNSFDLGLNVGLMTFSEEPYVDLAAVALPLRTSVTVEAKQLYPLLVSGTYSFLSGDARPYLGLGTGLYFGKTIKTVIVEEGVTISNESRKVTEFGLSPRLGVFLGRVNLGVIYHAVEEVNFLQFNVGVRIGSRD